MAEKSADDSRGGLEDCIFNLNQEIIYQALLSEDYEFGLNKRKISAIYFLITKAQDGDDKSGFGYDAYICPVWEDEPHEITVIGINPSIGALIENFLTGDGKLPGKMLKLPESYCQLRARYAQLTNEHQLVYRNLNRTPKSKHCISSPKLGGDKIFSFSQTINKDIKKLEYEMNRMYFEAFLRQYGKEWMQNPDVILGHYNINKS